MPVRLLCAAAGAAFLVVFPSVARGAPPDTGSVTVSAPRSTEAPDLIGVVRDSLGAPLHNAQVIVAEVGRTTTTDRAGEFRIRGLPAGSYHLTVVMLGFAPAHVAATLPESGNAVRVEVVMRPTLLRLSGVVVTASPVGADPLAITQSTIEVSGAALAQNLGPSVAHTLASQPGMSVRYNGPSAALPVIRGMTGERILVLQDGERAGDLSAASTDHGLTIDPIAADRIEVVRGPASLLYGNNALGGVINVISNDIPTSIPNHLEGRAGVQTESAMPGAALSATVTQPLGEHVAVSVRGNYRRAQDVRVGGSGTLPNTDSEGSGGLASLGYVGERATVGAAFKAEMFEYGVPSAPDAEESGIRLDGHRTQASLRSTYDLRSVHVPLIKVDGTAQWYTHDEIESDGAIGTTFELRTQTANASAKTQFGRWVGAIGAQALFKQYEAEGEEALTPGARSTSGGAFIYQEVPLTTSARDESHTPRLQLGARYDRYRIVSSDGGAQFGPATSRTFDNVSGSVGLSLPLGRGITLSGSAARAFRAPTVEELFANGFHAATNTFERGNPDLEAETNAGVDGVLRVQSGTKSLQLSGYWNRVNDYIALAPEAPITVDQDALAPEARARYVQQDATLTGFEAQAEAELFPRVVVGLMADAVRGTFADDTPLPFMPAARVGGSARWTSGAWELGGDVRHAFRQRDPGPLEFRAESYTVAGLSLSFNIVGGDRAHSITLRADNLGDVRYRDATSRIKAYAFNPGRSVNLMYRVLF
ncbi:MAG TPA: TonB-dependent receptor [Gemmatimonadaceae bacterium]|nr:TonB-dependent receptor [Gemmatimonadaceae bacterium]